jgi:hypothetical protein
MTMGVHMSKKVICRLPNASTMIYGIEFKPHQHGGVISTQVLSDKEAEQFAFVPGYLVVDPDGADDIGAPEVIPPVGISPEAKAASDLASAEKRQSIEDSLAADRKAKADAKKADAKAAADAKKAADDGEDTNAADGAAK